MESENITAQAESGIRVASARATNVFTRESGGWRLLVHHAPPVPVDLAPPLAGTPQ